MGKQVWLKNLDFVFEGKKAIHFCNYKNSVLIVENLGNKGINASDIHSLPTLN